MRTIASSLVVCLLGTAPLAARAQDATVEAREHFARGVGLFDQHRYQPALEEFQRAYALRSHPAVLVNIANCLVQLGRYPEAVLHFERYLSESTNLPAAQRRETERALEDARTHIGEILLDIQPPGATVRVDGREVGSAPFSRPLVVPSGQHEVEASAPGRTAATRSVEVAGGMTATVRIALEPAHETPTPPAVEQGGDAAARSPAIATGTARLSIETTEPGLPVVVADREVGQTPWEGPVPTGGATVSVGSWTGPVELDEGQHGRLRLEPEDSGPDERMPKLIIGGAVAGGLLLGSIVTGVLALDAQGEFDDVATEIENDRPTGEELRQLQSQGRDAADRLDTWSTVSDVLLVCSLTAAAGTLVYWFVAAPRAALRAHFELGAGPGGVRVAGQF